MMLAACYVSTVDAHAPSPWNAPETVAGFAQSSPNAVLMRFAEDEIRRAGRALRQLVDARSRERGRILAERFQQSVLPLFIHDDRGRPRRIGSCALVSVDGCHFAFTAGHVVADADRLYLPGGPHRKLFPIPCGVCFRTRTEPNIDLDIGVFPLYSTDSDLLLADYKFLAADEIDDADVPSSPAFGQNSLFLFGYSASRSQVKISHEHLHIDQRSFQLTTLPALPDVWQRERINPDVHVALDFDRKAVVVGGQSYTPPDLYGVSGGGIFQLVGHSAEGKLVAIATEHRSRAHVIVGTRIEHFLTAARNVIRKNPNVFD